MAKKAAGREGYQNKSRRPCVTADIERYCRGLNEWPRRVFFRRFHAATDSLTALHGKPDGQRREKECGSNRVFEGKRIDCRAVSFLN
jgi:hypothetical protein